MWTRPKKQLFPYAIVVMLAYIGFSLPLPILPVLLLDPEHAFLSAETSNAVKTILVGIILTAYPLGQFLGSPILGRFSDRYGRKRIILLSLGGTVAGFILAGIGVIKLDFSLLFVGLFFCGLCEGNTSIAQSAIADISPKEERGRYFGWLNFFITAGFILGPLIGGLLSHATWLPFAAMAAPFWAGSLLTLAGIVLLAWKGEETNFNPPKKEGSILTSFKALLAIPKLKLFYLANFFLSLGLYYFYRFVGVYLKQTFQFSPAKLGYFLAFDAAAFAVGLFLLIPYFEKKLSPQTNTTLFTLIFGLFLILFVLPRNSINLYWVLILIGFSLALSLTYSAVIVSLCVDEARQGQAMGILVSLQMLAQVLTSASGGFMAAWIPALPILVGALMCFICTALLFFDQRKEKLAREPARKDD